MRETSMKIIYEVVYGPKKESDRECKTFSDLGQAQEFFKKKQKDFHVDIYKIITTITQIKLT